jgi:phenylpropionate dioxygenase-like ring-hydroxylating dioxygenase large terminal subunit
MLNAADRPTAAGDHLELIERARPGFSLEQPFYLNEEIYARDLELVIGRYWLLVAHVSELSGAGDYVVREAAGESLILVRDGPGQVHALLNVCRHRGSRVCTEREGTRQRLVCPYHAWSYGLDGRLLAAHATPPGFCKADYGLHSAHVAVIEGLVFVNLSANPPSLTGAKAALERFMGPLQLADTKIIARRTYPVAANWKLVVENFLECYHCGPAHPEYCSVHESSIALSTSGTKRRAEYGRRIEEWSAEVEKLGLPTGAVLGGFGFEDDEHKGHGSAALGDQAKFDQVGTRDGSRRWAINHEISEETYEAYRLPLREGYLTQSRDGTPVAPPLGSLTEHDAGETVTMIGHNSHVLAASDYAVLVRLLPRAATSTDVELTWLVRADAEEGIDYDVDEVVWLWDVTTRQDADITAHNQDGVRSAYYRPGPYSTVEWDTDHFVRAYLRALSCRGQ